ncbi:hypothetical protein [Plesiomonas shigelloides]|uniref:hypothetical protein n=1 Tax=Plesiomonas shigelloides TaxID=703 RepID=UPI00131C6624|nr:hypothetical protein [Plesiomonas shigelloides]
MIVSVLQLIAGRKHNILSVRPFVTPHIERDNNSITFYLRNDGLGPALIKGFHVKLGNNEIVNPNNDPYRNWVLSGNKGIISFEYEYFLPTVNSAIKANDKVQLLKVTFEKYDAELLDLTEEQFSFLLTYTSMYEDKLCVSGI